MRFSWRFLLAVTGIGLCSLSLAVWAQTKTKSGVADEIKGYTSWPQVTRDLVEMDPAVAVLCISPPPSLLLPTAKGTQGPHARKFIRVYVNKIGEEQMTTRKNPRFPVGSVIVKQKLPLIESKTSKASKARIQRVSSTPELLTVMIKHKAGYDPKNGDWEYMVTDGAGKKVTQRGQIESCQNCHRSYAKTDYIVRSYLPKEVRAALKDLDETEAQSKPR